MITVKEYAQERGISIQAVHKSMTGKTKAPLLEGHVVVKAGVKYLDDEAVAILDTDRHKSEYIILKEDSSATIEEQREQIEKLLVKTAAQADRIAELAEWKAENAVAIAEAGNRQLLLEEQTHRVDELSAELQAACQSANDLQTANTELFAVNTELQAENDQLRTELERMKKRSLWQRIRNRE